jgi:two-component system, cell cycle response regulator DivK
MAITRILVVEDNRDNMTLIYDVLTSLDYEVLQAVDGEQGVAMAAEQKPHLILMDLSLPRMDGWTAARTIKSNDALKHIPVIALTAHAMVGDRERALEAGCDDYITKPINLPELASKLTRHLSKPTTSAPAPTTDKVASPVVTKPSSDPASATANNPQSSTATPKNS